MQGSGIWSPPTGTLGRIVAEAETRVQALRGSASKLQDAARQAAHPRRSLEAALRRETVAVIAEVKRRSPSKGWIAQGLSTVDQARAYEAGGAAAISVLTEPNHFDGSVADLDAVAAAVNVPVLKKDFHIDPIQLVEARAHGATAALLIARALAPDRLEAMLEAARWMTLEAIVEIRDEHELRRALDAGAGIIGINNRDLETLVIDPATSERLLPLIPSSVIAIAESGMGSVADVERVASFGADAVLVGSSLSASGDPAAMVARLSTVRRKGRDT
ncbi:MAG TPA: indole-3-glycerol phosphate synthase TrpC [Gemmatimonadaceae bacterium]|nr:indole-3-glycerol phosphate synthase TrpC [Gemmatimonadaceae bacterium]